MKEEKKILNVLGLIAEKWFFIWMFCMICSLGIVLITPIMLFKDGYITVGVIWGLFIYIPFVVYFGAVISGKAN